MRVNKILGTPEWKKINENKFEKRTGEKRKKSVTKVK